MTIGLCRAASASCTRPPAPLPSSHWLILANIWVLLSPFVARCLQEHDKVYYTMKQPFILSIHAARSRYAQFISEYRLLQTIKLGTNSGTQLVETNSICNTSSTAKTYIMEYISDQNVSPKVLLSLTEELIFFGIRRSNKWYSFISQVWTRLLPANLFE